MKSGNTLDRRVVLAGAQARRRVPHRNSELQRKDFKRSPRVRMECFSHCIDRFLTFGDSPKVFKSHGFRANGRFPDQTLTLGLDSAGKNAFLESRVDCPGSSGFGKKRFS